ARSYMPWSGWKEKQQPGAIGPASAAGCAQRRFINDKRKGRQVSAVLFLRPKPGQPCGLAISANVCLCKRAKCFASFSAKYRRRILGKPLPFFGARFIMIGAWKSAFPWGWGRASGQGRNPRWAARREGRNVY